MRQKFIFVTSGVVSSLGKGLASASIRNPEKAVDIALVGKYVKLQDSYKSLHEAPVHGGIANNARENKVPYLGLCLGMQLAVIEIGRNLTGLKGAHSTEFDTTTSSPPIFLIDKWVDQKNKAQKRDRFSDKGATMRLGAYPCKLKAGSLAFKAYGEELIYERHRHRYEFNMAFRKKLESCGMNVTGISPDGQFAEIIEVKNHPWFLTCQFHPEFRSKPFSPHPLFRDFIKASLKQKQERQRCRKK